MFRASLRHLARPAAFSTPKAPGIPKLGKAAQQAKSAFGNGPTIAPSATEALPASKPSLQHQYHAFRELLRNPPRGHPLRYVLLNKEFHNSVFIFAVILFLGPMAYHNTKQNSNWADYGYWDWRDLPLSLYCTFHMFKKDMQVNSDFVQEFRTRCSNDIEKRQIYREAHGLDKAARPWWENIMPGYQEKHELKAAVGRA